MTTRQNQSRGDPRGGFLPGDQHIMHQRSLIIWEPLVEELNVYIQSNTYIHPKEIAEKHELKPGSFRAYLKRRYPHKLRSVSRLKKEKATKIRAEKWDEKQKLVRQRKNQQYAKIAQFIFNLEDGMNVSQSAASVNMDLGQACRLLKKHDLMRKYTQQKIYDDETKNRAFQLRDQGLTVRAIAEIVGVAKSSVHLWCQQRKQNEQTT